MAEQIILNTDLYDNLLTERKGDYTAKPHITGTLYNTDIAARIVGYIRQAAIGAPLLPYSERVDRALQHLLAHPPSGMPWSTPQRDWLKRIAAQTRANVLVDCAALDDPDLIFKREGGGFNRLDKIFNGQLQPVLANAAVGSGIFLT